MNNSLSVQSGILKGKKIPIPSTVKGNSNFTSAILKKSVFSILDSLHLQNLINLEESFFIDLFAGSGQMGIEAVSRGFKNSVFFELDKNRFRGLKDFLPTIKKDFILLHRDSFRYYDSFDNEPVKSLVFYIDPPYSFWDLNLEKILRLTNDILNSYTQKNIVLLVQSPFDPKWNSFEIRQVGNNYLLSLVNKIL
ncbi:MAG TPA: RsmD family RNA methyltransferase [Leptospiraceae bacterium]|nr:RsmD family RNA methyltransferase [Leptospiraceae bacterium]HMW04003.1 RsmD family RNA methyltransferase [Leptospiraceae bacterium]HMX30893.1 RsmD family RNA methyltransferase [Leptospiraceae bacterium]HMY29997.1 RsmD family RNA methyltransferase [Leptospiraceae bacterium]HMZ65365.1 RsmD family RNA methyltransferase [Leptospiraceae bacterium]